MTLSQGPHRGDAQRRRQSGMTLIEVILGLSILAMVTIGLNQLADRWADDTKNTVAASQVRTFGEAVQSYIKDNYAAVQGVATATKPAIIDVPTLIAAQKLPAAYQNRNAFAQATCALVLEPTANRLQAMIITEGGKTVGDPSLSTVAATVGGSGGGVYSTDTTNIKGAVGGWQLATTTYDNRVNNLGKKCDGTAGNVRVTPGHPMMALWFENGDVSSAFVARDAVPGRPELNAMSTPLVMNSVQTLGGACSSTGAIAQDGTGAMLSCQSGKWKPVGDGNCQLTTANLNTLQSDRRCYNGIGLPNSPAGGDWIFVEVFRHYNLGVYYVTQRVVGMTGAAVGRTWTRTQQSGSAAGGWSGWKQVEDSQVAITAGGNVTAAGSVNSNSVTANGDVIAGNSVVANGDIISNTGTVQGTFIYSTGNMRAAGTIIADGDVRGEYLSARAGLRSYSTGDWGLIMGNAAGNLNSNPTSFVGSAHVNDIYLRAAGQWVSQMLKPKSYAISWYPSVCAGCTVTMAPNWWVGGTPVAIHGTSKNYGGWNCEGGTQYQLRDISGNVIRGWTWLAGTNIGNGSDGGSGMYDMHPFTIFMASNAYYVDFMGTGCHGGQVEVQGLMMQ